MQNSKIPIVNSKSDVSRIKMLPKPDTVDADRYQFVRFPFAKFCYAKLGTWVCRTPMRRNPPIDLPVYLKNSSGPVGRISEIYSDHFLAVTPSIYFTKTIPKRGCILYVKKPSKKKKRSSYTRVPFKKPTMWE